MGSITVYIYNIHTGSKPISVLKNLCASFGKTNHINVTNEGILYDDVKYGEAAVKNINGALFNGHPLNAIAQTYKKRPP